MSNSENYKAEIMALWRSQGITLDEVRIRIFDSLPRSVQADIVEQVRAEVRLKMPTSAIECKATIV